MIDRRRDVDLSALSPGEAEIVRVFRIALEQAHEEHVARMRHTLSVLELLRDGVARGAFAVTADRRRRTAAATRRVNRRAC